MTKVHSGIIPLEDVTAVNILPPMIILPNHIKQKLTTLK